MKKPIAQQLGILADFDGPLPANYSKSDHKPLTRQVWLMIRDSGSTGASAVEVSRKLGHGEASIKTRFHELRGLGYIRPTEAFREGPVFIATEKELR